VKKDLDTLATALYVKIDDLLKASPELSPWRPDDGFEPELTDAELVTLSVMQALLGFTSERRWLRHAGKHLGHLFRYLPKQSGYCSTAWSIAATTPSRSVVGRPCSGRTNRCAFFALSDRVVALARSEGLAVSNIRRPADRADPRDMTRAGSSPRRCAASRTRR
jgi:hypothetical protein